MAARSSGLPNNFGLTAAFTITLCILLGCLAGCASASHPAQTHPTGVHPACSGAAATATPSQPSQPSACPVRLLVFTKTAAFRHASIPDAQNAIRQLASANGWYVDFTEDSGAFTDSTLARYNVVAFVLTTGDVLNTAQEAAFERYIRAGGGFVGVHSASDTAYNWAWYDGLVGAHNNQQDKHSGVVRATINVVDRTHLSTAMLPAQWVRTDEWYNFAVNPRPRVHVLMTMDESTYAGGTMGADHPIAWYHAYDGGRAWFTALGHTSESYHEPLFLAHLAGGIEYAAGQPSGATTRLVPSSKVARRNYSTQAWVGIPFRLPPTAPFPLTASAQTDPCAPSLPSLTAACQAHSPALSVPLAPQCSCCCCC